MDLSCSTQTPDEHESCAANSTVNDAARSPRLGASQQPNKDAAEATECVAVHGESRDLTEMNLHQVGIKPQSPLRPRFAPSSPTVSSRPQSAWASTSPSFRRESVTSIPSERSPEREARSSIETKYTEEDDATDPSETTSNPPSVEDDVTRDSRDMLIDRLIDVLGHLTSDDGRTYHTTHLDAMHEQVAHLETIAARRAYYGQGHRRNTSTASSSYFPEPMRSPTQSLRPLPSRTSTADLTPYLPAPEASTSPTAPLIAPAAQTFPADFSERAAKEAKALCNNMSNAIARLQKRREQAEELNVVLAAQHNASAAQARDLRAQLKTVEDELQTSEVDLRHLRLELRSIEVQAMGHVPPDADQALKRSIALWKAQWRTARDQWAERRGSSLDEGTMSMNMSMVTTTQGTLKTERITQ